MRVLLSAYACRPNAGSEPGVGWNWATHLAARGMEVHVLVAKRNQGAVEAALREKVFPNLHFTFVAVPFEWAKKNEAMHYVLWQIAALKAARELNERFRFHVVHHVTYASIHVPSQLWRLGIPVVFGPVGGGQQTPPSVLNLFGAEKSKERLRSSVTGALKSSCFHRHSLQQMSWILAANSDTLRLVKASGCANAGLMCDTAIPDNYFAAAPRNFEGRKGLKLLWVGRMLRRKALPLALDALKRAHADATLTSAGDGVAPEEVHRMIGERSLQQRVCWKGSRLTYEELRNAYAQHDAMLFTSLRDSFGSQLLEALAMGLPVITLDLHGAHDFVPDGASLKVIVGNPDETAGNLARAIERYDRLTPVERSRMSMTALNFARTLNWTARAEFAENLYREILSKAPYSEETPASQMAAVSA